MQTEVLTDRNIILGGYLSIVKNSLAEMMLSGMIAASYLSWLIYSVTR